MESQSGERIRIVLRSIQILDRKEPFFKKRGEFRFQARVAVGPSNTVVETRFPENGVYYMSDEPGHNWLRLDLPIFEGEAADQLAVELLGEEVDELSANDHLNPYRRIFTGTPENWVGSYGPGDLEAIEPEDIGDWRVWYSIERV